jgi:hypothetical protein
MGRSPLSFGDTQQRWWKSTVMVYWSGKQVSHQVHRLVQDAAQRRIDRLRYS